MVKISIFVLRGMWNFSFENHPDLKRHSLNYSNSPKTREDLLSHNSTMKKMELHRREKHALDVRFKLISSWKRTQSLRRLLSSTLPSDLLLQSTFTFFFSISFAKTPRAFHLRFVFCGYCYDAFYYVEKEYYRRVIRDVKVKFIKWN